MHLALARRRLGGEPPRAVVERLLARDDDGARLTPLAAQLDRQAVALLLGLVLPADRAFELLQGLGPEERLLLLAPALDGPGRWEAAHAGARVVAAVVDPDALTPAQAEALVARGPVDGLELPLRLLPCRALGPDHLALVAPRLEGEPAPVDPPVDPEDIADLLRALHARGLVLGRDPRAAAVRRPDGRPGLRGFDLIASADPQRRAAGQRADLERLAAGGPPPRSRADLRAFLDDLLAEGAPLTPAEARDLLPPWLDAPPDVVRDALLDLADEAWAAGRPLRVDEAGRFAAGVA
ncbi:MAG: hypothetical protein M9894_25220 [Planctomycetes bacterium]|nr:hypothetical protein [Planctomycetota bacterium]